MLVYQSVQLETSNNFVHPKKLWEFGLHDVSKMNRQGLTVKMSAENGLQLGPRFGQVFS